MPHYRLYALTPDDLVRTTYNVKATDDGEAIQLARLRLEHADIELWCGRRKVALEPQDGLAIIPSSPVSASPASLTLAAEQIAADRRPIRTKTFNGRAPEGGNSS